MHPRAKRGVRRLTLSNTTRQVLREQRVLVASAGLRAGQLWEHLDLVFPDALGRARPGYQISSQFRTTVRRLGLGRVRFHDLRHTAATLMLSGGVHPKVVSERLGHASISITLDTYSHVLPDMQREAAETIDRILGRVSRGA